MMMSDRRRKNSAQCKSEAAIAALNGGNTVSQVALDRGGQSVQVNKWEKRLLVGSLAGERVEATDRGSRYRSVNFTSHFEAEGVWISVDGRGRWLDNVFNERFWRTVRYEDVYIRYYESVSEFYGGLARKVAFYTEERPHQALNF